MSEVVETKTAQKVVVDPADAVFCADCKQAMQPVENDGSEVKQLRCGQCMYGIELRGSTSDPASDGKVLASRQNENLRNGVRDKVWRYVLTNRRKWLLGLLVLTAVLILAALNCLAPTLTSLALHKSQHFHLGGGPSEGKYRFEEAILYSDNRREEWSWINWQGFHSSSEGYYSTAGQSLEPVGAKKMIGRPVDYAGNLEHATLDVWTTTGGNVVVRRARADQLPFRDALCPPVRPIVDGMKLAKYPNQRPSLVSLPFGASVQKHWEIEPPPRTLVDLSSINALILSRQPGMHAISGETVHLKPGDYIANQLHNTTVFGSVGPYGRIRIFLQDEPGIPGGVDFENCWVGSSRQHPEDFQIWYNGTAPIRIKNHSNVYAVIYAPHANVEIGPDIKFEGAIVCKSLDIRGGLIFFDTDLQKVADWH